jgi:hypothetical protein
VCAQPDAQGRHGAVREDAAQWHDDALALHLRVGGLSVDLDLPEAQVAELRRDRVQLDPVDAVA